LRRAERQVRLYRTGLMASLLVLVGLVVGGVVWLRWERAERQAEQARRAEETRVQVEAALERAEALMRESRWDAAEAALALAVGRLSLGGPDDLRDRAEQMQKDIRLIKALEEIRLAHEVVMDEPAK
jgi:hypothetical protein